MVTCSVGDCKNTAHTRNKDTNKFSFFKFPKNKTVSKEWVRLCNNMKRINVEYARICSAHFVEEDYSLKCRMIPDCRIQLRPDAVPSLNLPTFWYTNDDTDSAKEHYCSGECNNCLEGEEVQYEEIEILDGAHVHTEEIPFPDSTSVNEIVIDDEDHVQDDESLDVEYCQDANMEILPNTDYSSGHSELEFSQIIEECDSEDDESVWSASVTFPSASECETKVFIQSNNEEVSNDAMPPTSIAVLEKQIIKEGFKIEKDDVSMTDTEQDELFGKTLMSMVRSLPRLKQNDVKMQLMQVVINAQNVELYNGNAEC